MAVKSLARSGLITFEKYSSMLAGNDAFSPGSYDLLATTILSSSQASVTFSSLGAYASTYQHLQLRIVGRGSNSNVWNQYRMRFNGDSGTNYGRHYLYGARGLVGSNSYVNENGYIDGSTQTGNSASSGIFGAAVFDLLDAFETSKYLTIRGLGGRYPGGDDPIFLLSGLWRNTASLTSIEILNDYSWVSGSRFSLYGLRAS